MPPPARQIVYVDTNVVIEAIDTGCWLALLNHFDIRTVAEVRRETQAGNRRIKSYVVVDKEMFDAKVKVTEVSSVQIAAAQLRTHLLTQIDALAKDGALLDAEERAAIDAGRARLEAAMAGDSRDEINAAAEALETLSKPFAERRMDRGIREALSGLSVKELESRVGE
jgi:hypothetical protein